MPSPFRVLEILVYSLSAFLPYVLLTVYPFRNHLRFGNSATACLTALLAAIQLTADVMLGLSFTEDTGLVTLICLSLYVVFYLLLFKAKITKVLFAVFGTANLALILTSAAKSLSIGLYPDEAGRLYHWSHTVSLLVLQFLVLIPYAYILVKWLSPILASKAKKARWSFLWVIPFVFLAIWYCTMFPGNTDPILASAPWVRNTIGLIAVNLLAGILYAHKCGKSGIKPIEFIMSNVSQASTPAEAPAASAAPEVPSAAPQKSEGPSPLPEQMQDLQYCNLRERVKESERFHQELRRHLNTMSYHLESKDYNKLQSHFASLQNQLAQSSDTSFCEHSTTNRILNYYARQAGYCGVKFNANVVLPQEISISDADLATMVGNLLDNALDACKQQKSSDRRVWITGQLDRHTLHLTVENTYDAAIRQDDHDRYLSSKHAGFGIGLEVCKEIAKRHKGALNITSANYIFKTDVTLKLK